VVQAFWAVPGKRAPTKPVYNSDRGLQANICATSISMRS
jgi:hypothetical protein